MNRIFIGFDPRQLVSYTTLCTSIITRTDTPVAITPLVLHQLPLRRSGLTPFTFSRFLVPWLCHFQGWALFLDADIFLRADINDLFSLANGKHAVMVSKNKLKFEWASVMLFNCGHPDNEILTPEYIEDAHKLHGIEWTQNVGDLPSEWNCLIGYDAPSKDTKLVHYTQGVPAWPETDNSPFANEWKEDARVSVHADSWDSIMGNSVHAKPVLERRFREHGIDTHALEDLRA